MDISAAQLTQSKDRQTRLILILGALTWFLHLNIIYALASLSCKWGWFSFTVAGITGPQFVETVITVITLLLMLPMIYLPWRNWRQFQTEKQTVNPQMLQDTEKDRRPLLAFVAMLLNSLFFLFIIAFLVPVFALHVCGQA